MNSPNLMQNRLTLEICNELPLISLAVLVQGSRIFFTFKKVNGHVVNKRKKASSSRQNFKGE